MVWEMQTIPWVLKNEIETQTDLKTKKQEENNKAWHVSHYACKGEHICKRQMQFNYVNKNYFYKKKPSMEQGNL